MLGKRRSDFERDPHVGRMERMYGRRCDADHNHGNTAEVDGLPDDLARSSKLALPETAGENRGNRADRGVIRRREAPARNRAPSEGGKIAAGYERASDARRLVFPREA